MSDEAKKKELENDEDMKDRTDDEEEETRKQRRHKKTRNEEKKDGWLRPMWKTVTACVGSAILGSGLTYGAGKLGQKMANKKAQKQLAEYQNQQNQNSLDPNVY